MPYPWKTEPFSHQRDWWEKTRDVEAWAVLWEQGTGKSKLTVDTAASLYLDDEVDTIFVLAPNGVHRNWIVNEVPNHLPDSIDWTPLLWHSSKANNKGAKVAAAEALECRDLLVVAMSYDGLMTKLGDKFAQDLLSKRRPIMVLDESARIKNPKAKRSIRVLARGKAAGYRRILTGTPVANSPFDVYTQFKFLNPDIWNQIGCRSFAAFKSYFGIWEDMRDPRSGRMFRNLVRYRNLDMLAKITAQVGCRVVKDDVLDLPPKLYQKRYFDLSPEQARAYAEMAESYMIRFEAGEVDAMLIIVQLIRFQQIVSGFAPITDPETGDSLGTVALDNARIRAFADVVEDMPTGKFIVWAKFTHDVDLILRTLAEMEIEAVRYDGPTSTEDRADAIERFQNGSARAFVANPSAAGEGLTLHAATTVIYYNNSYKLTDRLQSEDRAHRIGQKHAVTYIDLVAVGTIDEKITDALRNKLDIASVITGDRLKEWI